MKDFYFFINPLPGVIMEGKINGLQQIPAMTAYLLLTHSFAAIPSSELLIIISDAMPF